MTDTSSQAQRYDSVEHRRSSAPHRIVLHLKPVKAERKPRKRWQVDGRQPDFVTARVVAQLWDWADLDGLTTATDRQVAGARLGAGTGLSPSTVNHHRRIAAAAGLIEYVHVPDPANPRGPRDATVVRVTEAGRAFVQVSDALQNNEHEVLREHRVRSFAQPRSGLDNPADDHWCRRSNAHLAWMALRDGPLSKKELAARTGMSRQTTANQWQYLLGQGLCIETDDGRLIRNPAMENTAGSFDIQERRIVGFAKQRLGYERFLIRTGVWRRAERPTTGKLAA